jgi:hypothetical protein
LTAVRDKEKPLGTGLSSTATLGCAVFSLHSKLDARRLRKPHSQEWLCYHNLLTP